jgi:beta-N-acetylhexosaminidase
MESGMQMAVLPFSEILSKYPIARRFMAGFEGRTLPPWLRELLEQGLAGVAIYPRNFRGADELSALTASIRAAASGPLLIGIDQEGGTRFSLPEPFTQWPSPAKLGAHGDANLVRKMARAMGDELAAAGCNLDFAPMLDMHLNPTSPVTQVRSYGADLDLVGRIGCAFLEGLAEASVLGCAKHFPGHGDTAIDPHEDLPISQNMLEKLERTELRPFAAAIGAGVQTIMTAHILLPKIDPVHPASASREILTNILRQKMGFQGLILADDLGMGALARRFAPGEAAVATFAAGADIAMHCHDSAQLTHSLAATIRALRTGILSVDEWRAAGERISGVLERIAEPKTHSPDVIGCAPHRALAAEITAQIAPD